MDSRVRASQEQLLILLEFMETHGDLARPLAGPQGRVRSDRLWTELTNSLNAVGSGVNKTTDKWKKVWPDWKSKTKKKGLNLRQHTRGTGGGPASRQTLSAIEERVLAIMGVLSVEGQASVEELGFNTSQSPARDDPVAVDDMVYLEFHDETPHLPSPEPSTSQSANSLLLPFTSQMQTPLPSRLLVHPPRSSQGRQPVAPAPPATPFPPPPAPAAPAPPVPAAPAPPVSAAPAPPAPAAPTPPAQAAPTPTTPRRRRAPAPRAPATPPSARRRPRLRSPATPQSAGARRRRQAPTPFERAASEFAAVELRRLELEETRDRREHERQLRALEVEHERNQVFRDLVDVARGLLDHYRSRDNTEPLNIE